MAISQPPFQSTLVDADDRVQTPWAQWFSQLQPILQSVVASGPTSGRPTQNLFIGYPYFDTTIDQTVYWNGVIWVTYAPSTTGTSILKGNGTGGFNNAIAGIDFAPATSGNAILYGNGGGGFSSVAIGSGVTFAGGVLSATGSGGTVTAVTGTAPIASTGGTTPAISMAAATATVNGYLTSTDWNTFNNKAPATSGTAILYGNGTGGFSNVTIGSGVTFVAGTLSATGSGGTVTAVTGSGNIASSGGTTPNITFTGTLPIANGGTNGTATPTAGAVAVGNGTQYAFTAAGSAGQVLTSNGSTVPTWATVSTGVGTTGYWGSFWDTSNQTAASTTVAYTINIGTSDPNNNGVSIVSGNQITVAHAGVYNIQYSIQFENIGTGNKNYNVDVWFRLNGVNIPDSNSTYWIASKNSTVNGELIAAVNYVLSLNAGNYIQLMWAVSDVDISIATLPATSSPTVPQTPGVIVSVTPITEIGIGYYNLTSVSSVAIATGSKTFTTNLSNISTAFTVGTRVRVAYVITPANYMEGVITSFSGTTLVVNVDSIGGSGTYANWTISVAGIQGSNGVTSITGTANQVIASASTGAVTLSLPQAIATTSSPTFVGTNFSGTATSLSIGGNAATASKWATARNLAGNSVDGSANVAFANKFIVQGTTDTGLTGAQFLGALGTGLVKNTTSTGVLTIAASGTDYAPATSGSAILYGNGSGGFSSVSIGTGVSFTAGTLSASGSGGTVTSVGFTGGLITVATATTTPAFTVAGTSGGIPYFSSASTWATSAALTANALIIGGGAGSAPATTTTGTGVLTALGTNVGSAGAFVTFNGSLGTPSSGTVTNLTGTASININGTVGATTATTGKFTTLEYSSTLTGGTGIIAIGTSQIYKDASGNVGIGTSSPGYLLNVSKNGSGGDLAQLARFTDTNTSNSLGPFHLTLGVANHFAQNPSPVLCGTNGIALGVGDGSDLANQRKLTIDSSGNVGIGTSSPTSPLTIASSSTLAAGSPSLIMFGSNNTERMAIFSNVQPVFVGNGFQGTYAVPVAVGSLNTLVDIQGRGYDGASYGIGGRIQVLPEATWTTISHPAILVFSTTGSGSTAITERMRITSAGGISFGSSGTAYGTSGQVLTSAGNAAPTWTTPTTGTVTGVTGTAPVVSSGGTAPAISMAAATASVNGYLRSTDWTTFNNKQPAGAYLTASTGVTTFAGNSTGLTPTAATSGAITLAGTLVGANGGTGVANTGKTFTIGGNFTTSGAFTTSLTVTANTALTLPISGTVISSVTAPAANPITGTPSASNYLRGDGTWATFTTGTVTSVGFTGGLITVATPTTTPAFTVAGTSGGIPYFSSASTWASSAALALNSLVIGGGAGLAPATTTTGTGVLTALGTNVGAAGAFVTFNGSLGTPSSGTVTNLTGTASININGTVGATTANTGKFTNLAYTGTLTGSTGILNIGSGQVYKDASGNVGIGTASPGYLLNVSKNGSGGDLAQLARFTDTNTSNSIGPLHLTIGAANHFAVSPSPVLCGTNGIALGVGDGSNLASQRRLTIDVSGNVGIGTNSPTGRLDVVGTIKTSGYTVATLPTGVVGARAYVTNALAPTFGATVVTGGTVTIPVFYNGTNWIVG